MSIQETWGMRCPNCGSDEKIQIALTTWADLTVEELIDDCYELPKEFKSGEWPWRHMKIDFEAAAEEAKQDYTSVEFFGITYWIR